MCKVCEHNESMETEWQSLDVRINGSALEIGYDAYSTDSSFNTTITVNFCPMCGNKLPASIKQQVKPKLLFSTDEFGARLVDGVYATRIDIGNWVIATSRTQAAKLLNTGKASLYCIKVPGVAGINPSVLPEVEKWRKVQKQKQFGI